MAKVAKDNNVLVKQNYYFIINIFIVIIPKIYNLILPWFGLKWHLQIQENDRLILTDLGNFVEVSLNILVIGLVVWYNFASARKGTTINKAELDNLIQEKEGLVGTSQLLRKIMLSTYKTCSSKYDTLLTKIKEMDIKNPTRSVKIVSNPCKQLKSIIGHLVSCVAQVTDVDESSLRTRVAYRLKDGEWTWITGYSSSGYFNIANLSATANTTFSCITRKDSSRESFIFFNRKSMAVKNGKYIYEPFRDFDEEVWKDDTVTTDGSILAMSLFVGDSCSQMFAEMVIFIDTTDECLFTTNETKDNVRSIKNVLKQEVFRTFEERLKIELALLYISCYDKNK